MPNGFYTNKQFYFEKLSLVVVHCLIVKKIIFQAIQFSPTVLIQTIHFSIIKVFVHTR